MILVYSPQLTARVKYSIKLVLYCIMGTEVKFTSEHDVFLKSDLPKLNYSLDPFDTEAFHIAPVGLLTQKGVKLQHLTMGSWNNLSCFFETHSSNVPFDIFSCVFFLVSRYEEYYTAVNLDVHGRYHPHQSLAYQEGFLSQPLVNLWGKKLKELLVQKFPSLEFEHIRHYKALFSIDVDNAYAYKGKGITRNTLGVLQACLKAQFTEASVRAKVCLNQQQDPYDTYAYQAMIADKYQLKYLYFILLGDYGTYDKNLPHHSEVYTELIKTLSDYHHIGIHPSYGSNANEWQVGKEIKRLKCILHREICCSRQHFLKLQLPSTYQTLLQYEITDDFTMGYPDEVGFRASICTPFYFYDLEQEEETSLRIHPFAVMDGTLKDYLNCNVETAKQIVSELIDAVQLVDGVFIMIWHNDSLSNQDKWNGWRDVFEWSIEKSRRPL